MKTKTFKNGAWAIMDDPSFPSGMIRVKAYGSGGNVLDSILCDTKRQAEEYFRAFCALARNS